MFHGEIMFHFLTSMYDTCATCRLYSASRMCVNCGFEERRCTVVIHCETNHLKRTIAVLNKTFVKSNHRIVIGIQCDRNHLSNKFIELTNNATNRFVCKHEFV